MSMLGIFFGLAVIIILCYKGMNVIWVAPVAAVSVALLGGVSMLDTYTGAYMQGLGSFVISWFPVFMLGAIFGKMMDITGAAASIASWIIRKMGSRNAILAVVLSCGLLTYGGIALFVVVFAIYPLALSIFREANISRKLIPATIAHGSFTFTMTAFPGSPQVQNLIPMDYFGTTPMAAPLIGIVTGIIMLVLGVMWLKHRENKLRMQGDGFDEPGKEQAVTVPENLPAPLLCILPLLTVIVALNVFELNIVACLVIGILLCGLFFFRSTPNIFSAVNEGAVRSVTSILSTSAAVGFGAVVKIVPGFESLTELVLGIKGPVLISEAISINFLSAACASASGGLGIALEALGEKYLATGVNPEILHRIAALSSGGLDTMPHGGSIIVLLQICGMSHRNSFSDIFVTCGIIPILATVVGIIMGSLGIC